MSAGPKETTAAMRRRLSRWTRVRLSKFFSGQRLDLFSVFWLFCGLIVWEKDAAGETLRVGRLENPPSLGNPFTTVGLPSSGVWTAVFDGLTMIDERGDLAPALALSWHNETPATWVFRLRPGVTFHNGKPFTAGTVAKVVEYLRREENSSLYVSAEVKDVVSVTVRDDLTIAFETREPDAIFPRRFNIIMMVEPDILDSVGMNQFALDPVGTGPFTLVDWGAQTQVTVLEAFADSWRAPQAVDRLELWNLADPNARITALASGDLDIVEGLSPDDEHITRGNGARLVTVPVPAVSAVALPNVGDPASPLQDKRVRQALNYAVNKQAIASALLHNRVEPASQGAAPMTFGFNSALEPYHYDPERAKALLSEANYPDGFPLSIEVLLVSASDDLVYQKVSEDLGRIGIDVEVRGIPFPQWMTKYMNNSWGETDAFSFLWDSSAYNDVSRPIRNYSCTKPKPFFCDPHIMPLIDESYRETDPSKRELLLKTIMAEMRDLAPSIFLVTGTTGFGVSERIDRFVVRPHGIMYEQITFARR